MSFFTKRYPPPGTPPGALVERRREEPPYRIRLVDFLADGQVLVEEDINPADCLPYLESETLTWVHVQGRPTVGSLHQLGEAFGLHPLAVEDVLNTGQRPKIEPFDHQLFVVLSLPLMADDEVEVHQVSFFMNRTFLVSFCEGEFDPFLQTVKRLHDGGARLRHRGVDFLLYSLLDIVIDQGFPVLENFGLQLEELEERILAQGGREILGKIHVVKRELILLRRMLWPQREVINQLLRDESDLIKGETRLYLRDCYDHTVQVMDLLETYREMTSSMLDIYLSSVNNRMNDIMRLLTVISTIFIPLTFIVGLYGMNFDRNASPWNMPELGWRFGYPLVSLLMVMIALGLLIFFRRKRWL